jgi:hypothetical protein
MIIINELIESVCSWKKVQLAMRVLKELFS